MIEQAKQLHLSAILLLLGGLLVTSVPAQYGPAQDPSASLRAQLSEVEANQSELKARLYQLEYDLKPENIERSLAGIGSTHPEELREQRRRQLETEKKGVLAQLDLLAASHARLEAAIAQADAEAYRQSASPIINNNVPIRSQPQPANTATSRKHSRRMLRHKVRKHRRLRNPVRY